jgi:phosphate acetyltransferase
MILRTMLALGGGLAAGLVLGARVPIVSSSRTDPMEVRMASCVLASLLSASNATTNPARIEVPQSLTDAGARAAA